MKYIIGQRYYSETEPELGLGIVIESESKIVQIFYPQAEQVRSYGVQSAPLKRFKLEIGDEIQYESKSTIVNDITELDGLIYYQTETDRVCENKIQAQLNINGPLERFFIQNFDNLPFYQTKYKSALNFRNYQQFEYKGFLGAKIRLIPHQIYVAQQILNLPKPKALLCDEVGLGKTIEALLVLSSLKQNELVKKSLIIVPESLKNQWLVELYKKFSFTAYIYNADDPDLEESLEQSQSVIIGRKELENWPEVHSLNWDMLIIDEAHQIEYFSESKIFKIINEINNNTFSTLLLSATPEITGEVNFFNQLKFLDPDKFDNFEDFQLKKEQFTKISKLILSIDQNDFNKSQLSSYLNQKEITELGKDAIKQTLADRYGLGRNFFRNTRENLQKFEKVFTQRVPIAQPITADLKKLTDNLVIKLKSEKIIEKIATTNDKFFIICHAKTVVLKLQKLLLDHANYKIALFHSDQTLLERDRQAAYFADPEGAQILICTEIGSEGRNFEFAHHMVLFDLPKTPDQLEQRIGRLDRIGQEHDIKIFVPYIKSSFEQILFSWYANVLGAFTKYNNSSSAFFQLKKQELNQLLNSPFSQDSLDQFINEKAAEFERFKEQQSSARDILHEIKSFNHKKSLAIIETIESFEKNNDLKPYLEQVFEHIGIDSEELNQNTYFIKPSYNMLIPSYYGVSPEGASYTFNRDFCIKHENIDLLNWEHPIVKTAYDIFLDSPLGNMNICSSETLGKNIYFEFIYSYQCVDKYKNIAGRYLPYTPLRVLLSAQGENLTEKISKKMLDKHELFPLSEDFIQGLKQLPKDHISELQNKALKQVQTRTNKYQSNAQKTLIEFTESELSRLKTIITDKKELEDGIAQLQSHIGNVERSILEAKIELFSLRVIIAQ